MPPTRCMLLAAAALRRSFCPLRWFGLLVVTFLCWVQPVLSQDTASLDRLLQAGKSIELSSELRAGRTDQLLPWLRQRAEEGHALPQYELASRLGKGSLDEALKWYARARMSRVLDAAECARSGHSAAVGWTLDLGYQHLETLARENEAKFSVAITEALKWETARTSRPGAKWICGDSKPASAEGDVLPQPTRQAERRKALDRLAARARDISARQWHLSQPVNPDGYAVISAPFIGTPRRWLDGERLYSELAYLPDALSPALKQRMPHASYVIWNVRTGEVQEASNVAEGQFCYFNGFVSYQRSVGDFLVFYEGSWGDVKEVARKRVRDDSGKVLPDADAFTYNRFSCRIAPRERFDKGFKFPLLEAHGYIPVSGDGSDLKYVRNGGGNPVPLPFSYGDIHGAKYSQHLNVYVVPNDLLGASDRLPLTFWLLAPDGSLGRETVPAGPWFGASRGFHVSRAGIVIWSHNRSGRTDDGFAGIYLARGGEVVKLLSGFVNGSDVSPDGCRIAAKLEHNDGRRPELKVVDACKREP